MTMDELMRLVLEICPGAFFSEDVDGEIIIHTNLWPSDQNDFLVSRD